MPEDSIKVLDISCKVKATPTAGHPFWFHKHLKKGFEEVGQTLITVGAITESSDWILGCLKYPWEKRAFAGFFLFVGCGHDSRKINRLIASDPEGARWILHFYEGGFREFVLLALVMAKNPTSGFYFNFNMTDPWHKFISPKARGLVNGMASAAFRFIFFRLRGMGTFSVETPFLQDLFKQTVNLELPIYRLFSTLDLQSSNCESKSFKYDVVFFPEGDVETELCLNALESVQKHTPVIASVVPRWDYKPSIKLRDQGTSLGAEFVEGILSQEKYASLYTAAKVAVFPYISEYYKISSSGRYIDALAGGASPIAPADSSLGAAIRSSGIGQTFESTSEQLAEAITGTMNSKNHHKAVSLLAQDTAMEILRCAKEQRAGAERFPLPLAPLLAVFGLVNFSLGFRMSAGRLANALGLAKMSRVVKDILSGLGVKI